MKRLIALVVVGVMSMVLSGCGQQAPKPTEMKVENTAAPAEHEVTPAAEVKSAEEAKSTEEAKPAEEAPAAKE